MRAARRLGAPVPAAVRADRHGLPLAVGGERVESIQEEWIVEDPWWGGKPLRRRYFELVLDGGRNLVVFWDLEGEAWYAQRA